MGWGGSTLARARLRVCFPLRSSRFRAVPHASPAVDALRRACTALTLDARKRRGTSTATCATEDTCWVRTQRTRRRAGVAHRTVCARCADTVAMEEQRSTWDTARSFATCAGTTFTTPTLTVSSATNADGCTTTSSRSNVRRFPRGEEPTKRTRSKNAVADLTRGAGAAWTPPVLATQKPFPTHSPGDRAASWSAADDGADTRALACVEAPALCWYVPCRTTGRGPLAGASRWPLPSPVADGNPGGNVACVPVDLAGQDCAVSTTLGPPAL